MIGNLLSAIGWVGVIASLITLALVAVQSIRQKIYGPGLAAAAVIAWTTFLFTR